MTGRDQRALLNEYLKENVYSDSLVYGDFQLVDSPSECKRELCPPLIHAQPLPITTYRSTQVTYRRRWKYPNMLRKIIAQMPRGTFRHFTPVHSVTFVLHPTQPGKHKVLLRTSTGYVKEYDYVIY